MPAGLAGLLSALFATEMFRGPIQRNTDLVYIVSFIRKSKKKNIPDFNFSRRFILGPPGTIDEGSYVKAGIYCVQHLSTHFLNSSGPLCRR